MVARLAKISCVAATALYITLVAFGNVTDYWTNFAFVTKVLDMNEVQDGAGIRWRAATSPALHQMAYLAIIVTEIAIAALTSAAAFAMLRALKSSPQSFRRAKAPAMIGLALGFLLFEGGFVAIGGEWFAMWRAPNDADAVPAAFRIAVTMISVLILISLEDGAA